MTTTKPEQQPCRECQQQVFHWSKCSLNKLEDYCTPVLESERTTQPVRECVGCGHPEIWCNDQGVCQARMDGYEGGRCLCRCINRPVQPSAASETEYLNTTCTETECRLCRLPPFARKSGMKHSGLTAFDPVTAASGGEGETLPAGYGRVNGNTFKFDLSKRVGGCASQAPGLVARELAAHTVSKYAARSIASSLVVLADGDGGPGYELCWCGDAEPHAVEQGHYSYCEGAADIVRWCLANGSDFTESPDEYVDRLSAPTPAPVPVEDAPERIWLQRRRMNNDDGSTLFEGFAQSDAQLPITAYEYVRADLHQPSRREDEPDGYYWRDRYEALKASRLTDAERAEVDVVEKRLNAVPEGQWRYQRSDNFIELRNGGWLIDFATPRSLAISEQQRDAVGEYVAHSPTDIRRLLQLVRKGE